MLETLKHKYFKSISLLTVFTFAIYMVAALVLVGKVKAASLTGISDTLTRLQVSTASSHDILFTMVGANTFATTETITYDFNEDGGGFVVDGAATVAGDFDFSDGTERVIFGVTAGAPDC